MDSLLFMPDEEDEPNVPRSAFEDSSSKYKPNVPASEGPSPLPPTFRYVSLRGILKRDKMWIVDTQQSDSPHSISIWSFCSWLYNGLKRALRCLYVSNTYLCFRKGVDYTFWNH
jgi:hypothetical protein